jgi:hypothetical protein
MSAAPVTALAAPRRRFTGTVVVDLTRHVDCDGWLTCQGYEVLAFGLAAARGLAVRLEIGALTALPAQCEGLGYALGCASVEVCGTDPDGVQNLVLWLRDRDEEEAG